MSPKKPTLDSRILATVFWGGLILAPIVGFVVLLSAPSTLRSARRTRPVSVATYAFDPLLSTATAGVRSIREAQLSARYFGTTPEEFLYRIDCDPRIFSAYVSGRDLSARRDALLRERLRALAPAWFPADSDPEAVFADSDFDPDDPNAYGAACCFDETRSEMILWVKFGPD